MKRHLPNAITLVNVFFGCCALFFLFYEQFTWAFWCCFIGGFADYMDGFVARMLKVNSELGKELDSLADMVTFGVFPGAIVFKLLEKSHLESYGGVVDESTALWCAIYSLPGFFITVFAALRLARFNLDTRQTDGFIGLPTPSATVFTLGLMMTYETNALGLRDLTTNMWFLYAIIPVLAFLMNSELPMFSLKFKKLQWKGNEIPLSFVLLTLISIPILGWVTFSFMVMLYVAFSVISYQLSVIKSSS